MEKINSKLWSVLMYFVMIGIFVLSIHIMLITDLAALPVTYIINISCDVMGVAIILFMLIGFLREAVIAQRDRSFMKILYLLGITLFVDLGCWCFDSIPYLGILVKLLNTVFYCMGIAMPLAFWEYVLIEINGDVKRHSAWDYFIHILGIFGILTVLLNWWFGYFFTVDELGVYRRTIFFPISYIIPYSMTFYLFFYILRQKISVKDKFVCISYEIVPLVVAVLQAFTYGLSLLFPATLLAVILIYGNVYLQRSRKIALQQKQLTEQELAIMVSQIQPHFLYNALTTISNLCRKDPEEAEETTVLFSQYLRMNLDSLKKKEPVPFMIEINHVKTYLTIEKKRFGENLNVEYDIQATAFEIPALSIQPIVENSVKHGIREKGEPGTVTIRTYEDESASYVVIEDDGVGFDVNAPKKDDGRSHVGMSNVINRLEMMVNATVDVESSPGNGCKTTIRIPKGK